MYIIYDDFYLNHDSGSLHPEDAGRLSAIMNAINRWELREKLILDKPYPATKEQVQLVHHEDYIDKIKMISERGGHFYLDADTVVSRYTYECALLAAGGCFKGIDLIFDEKAQSSKFFALIRPPGHHAFRDRGSGFCIFNNVALSAKYAQTKYNVGRIAILDFDAHHGNGTQDTFYTDHSVFYISFHQYPHYPGTGFYDEIGEGKGRKLNLNFPFPSKTGELAYIAAMLDIIIPVMRKFEPELILVSAGYDSHIEDFLSSLTLNDDSYYKIMYLVSYIAHLYCNDRLGIVLEGGYNHDATARSVVKTILGCSSEKNIFSEIKSEEELRESLDISANYRQSLKEDIMEMFDKVKKIFGI